MNGFLNLNKPVGISSNRCLSLVKRAFNIKKAGFIGTLDPFASGVLIIALGHATKLINYNRLDKKGYEFEIFWGKSTDTGDREGEVIDVSDNVPDPAQIEQILPSFIGEISQIPPKYSAIKINGRRACDLMRSGVDVEIKARNVIVHDLKLVSHSKNISKLRLSCGSGTYVRSIAVDLGAKLGIACHVSSLCRIYDNVFDIKNSVELKNLDKIKEIVLLKKYTWISMEQWLGDIPAITLEEGSAASFCMGQKVVNMQDIMGLCAVVDKAGRLIGVGDLTKDYLLPKRVLQG